MQANTTVSVETADFPGAARVSDARFTLIQQLCLSSVSVQGVDGYVVLNMYKTRSFLLTQSVTLLKYFVVVFSCVASESF